MLPDYCFSKSEIERRQSKSLSLTQSKTIPDNVDKLIELEKKGLAFGVPNKDYDDSYMIQYAKEVQGYIVSNDRFFDHIEKYSNRNEKEQKEIKKWVTKSVISYPFFP